MSRSFAWGRREKESIAEMPKESLCPSIARNKENGFSPCWGHPNNPVETTEQKGETENLLAGRSIKETPTPCGGKDPA